MASIEKRGKAWRVRMMVDGQKVSATFSTKQQAAAWAVQQEAELTGVRLPDKTLRDAMTRYRLEISPTKAGYRWEELRLRVMEDDEVARRPLARLATPDLAGWRDRRLAEVSAATVAREMALLRSVLRIAEKEWHWIRDNPMRDVSVPKSPPSRKRRVTDDEIERVTLALGLDADKAVTQSQRTALAFLFALETAMRAGEILGLTWPHVRPKAVHIPKSKNGDARDVPLSPRAREIIALFPKTDGPVFGLQTALRDALFRKARKAAEIPDLHFHDSRAEAIWRLSKKFDVLELARVIGHRDISSLMLYYNVSADELADRL